MLVYLYLVTRQNTLHYTLTSHFGIYLHEQNVCLHYIL